MAVALDGTGTANFVTGGTNTANTLTISASATSALAWLTFSTSAITNLTVSWNSSTQFFTQLATKASTSGTTYMTLWGLLNPSPGSALLVRAQWTGSANATIESVSFFNTNSNTLANCFLTTPTNSGASQLPSITVTSKSSDMAIGIFGATQTIDSVDNTSIYILNTGSSVKSAANRAAGAASVVLGASTAVSTAWASMGVDVAAGTDIISFTGLGLTSLRTRYTVIGA